MALTGLKYAAVLATAPMFTMGVAPAGAESVAPAKPTFSHASSGTSDATDFSAQRRRYYGRRGGGGGGAAAAAIAGGLIGTAIIASQGRRYYDEPYYGSPRRYYGGPGYGYGGGYGYYDRGW